MDDMNAFDSQLANVVLRRVGPSQPVNDAAIFTAITATQSPKWRFQSMFSATKFVVAGAILALFGGFLLAGVLTQPSEEQAPVVGASASASPDAQSTPDAATTYAAVRSQLVSEELRPGVSRVIRDGAGYEFAGGQPHRVSIAPDGSVWVMGTTTIAELGKPGSYQLGSPDLDFESIDEVEFGPDGTNWALSPSGLWGWPEGEFVAPAWAGYPLRTLAALPDGTVWASGAGGLARLDEDGWSAFPAADVPVDRPGGVALGDAAYLTATTDGHLWTVAATSDPDTHALRRYDGSSWESMEPLGPGRSFLVDALAAGSDGTVWVALRGCDETDCSWSGDEPLLASFDGSAWKVLSADDGVRFVGAPQMWDGIIGVSGDGIIMATQDADGTGTAISLAVFDSNGSLATLRELDGLLGSDVVDTISPAPDGSFWVSIWDNNVGGVIIIEPDALLADAATTTPDLLPGVDLVTEEVQPGVYRVLNDGVRDLVRLADRKERYLFGILDGNVVAGLDGSVWWFDTDGFFRLGEDAEHRWPKGLSENFRPGTTDIEVGPDGTLWLAGWFGVPGKSARMDVASYDGQAWSNEWSGAYLKRFATGVEVQQDGTVWMAWWTMKRDDPTGPVRAARLVDDGWEVLPGSVAARGRPQGTNLVVADDGASDVWLNDGLFGPPLHRHDGEGWVREETPDSGGVMRAAVGPDGTLWVRLKAECGSDNGCSILARRDGSEWEVYDSSYGIPLMGDHYQGFEGYFEVAPDRSIWFNPIGDYERTGTECDGIANFDGEAVTSFLRDICIYAMDLAPDGTVWLQAGEYRADVASGQVFDDVRPGPIHTYVITPEAVA